MPSRDHDLFIASDSGPFSTVYVIHPQTARGSAWLGEHLDDDGPRWAGGRVVESRYLGDIVLGALRAGLTVVDSLGREAVER